MSIKNHPQTSNFRKNADQFYRDNLIPKVYDIEDHQNFARWYFLRLHKVLTKSEMERTLANFIYDMDYYMSLPKLSKNFEII